MDPPQKVVRELFGGWGRKRSDVHALRTEARQYFADDPILAARVAALEHHEQRMLACAEQLFLELGQLPQTWLECCLRLFLGQARVGFRIVLSETDAHP